MHLQLKVRKIGNSLGVVFPKEVLAHLHAAEGDEVSATEAPDGKVILSPLRPEVSRQMAAAQDIIERYRSTLRELAK